MAVYSRHLLSGATNGRPIPVVATATPGTLIHTTGASGADELHIWASNVTTATATLTIEFGGVTDPGDHITKAYSVPANSAPIPICSGQSLAGSVIVRAFSGTASAINLTGYVNRIV